MVVDKLGTEKFSVNFCLLFVHGALAQGLNKFNPICSCLQLFAGADACKQTERLDPSGVTQAKGLLVTVVRGCSRLFAAVRGCSRLLTIFDIKFIFSQSQTPINDLSYVLQSECQSKLFDCFQVKVMHEILYN